MSDIVLVGKCKTRNRSGPFGGAFSAFKVLVDYVKQQSLNYCIIDINYRNYTNKLFAYFSALSEIVRVSSNNSVVVLNVSNSGIIIWGLPLLTLSKLLHFKLVIRVFGGRFDLYLNNLNFALRKLVLLVCAHSDLVFFETKFVINKLKTHIPNLKWFPNLRTRSRNTSLKKYSGKFVYLGLISQDKGIKDIVKLKSELGPQFNIDIYGRIDDLQFLSEEERFIFDSIYRGMVPHDEVTNILSHYDVLVLPTKWKNEGYPGVILEAMSLGLGVIASDKPGIRELLGAEYRWLHPEGNYSEFKYQITTLNNEAYNEMQKIVLARFPEFDLEKKMPIIMSLILNQA